MDITAFVNDVILGTADFFLDFLNTAAKMLWTTRDILSVLENGVTADGIVPPVTFFRGFGDSAGAWRAHQRCDRDNHGSTRRPPARNPDKDHRRCRPFSDFQSPAGLRGASR